jgi:hypothetical protein
MDMTTKDLPEKGLIGRRLDMRIPLDFLEKMAHGWCLASYLIINWQIKELVEEFRVQPMEGFYRTVAEHLGNYVYDNKMPPKEIAPAILNMAEDFLAGRTVNIRPGDYIVIQNFIRSEKKKAA